MALVDHLYLTLLLVIPVYGWHSHRRVVERARRGETFDRRTIYLQTHALEFLLLFGVVGLWLVNGRSIDQLGFVAPAGTGFWLGAGLAMLAVGLLVHSWLAARRMTLEERSRQFEKLGDLQYFLPASPGELRHFAALSIVAGVVEEIVYRGFLFWYLAWLMPVWGIVVCSAAIFAFGHSYQGAAGVLRIFVIGVAFGLLFLLSGSIWLPIALHALLDILQGAVLLEFSRRQGPAEEFPRPVH
jgi:membrane protease YdiL (CAAX protease family)